MKSDGKNLPTLILTVNKIVVFTVYSLAGLITTTLQHVRGHGTINTAGDKEFLKKLF